MSFSLPRKKMVSAHGQRHVMVWGSRERPEHTLMKALLWALYLPDYPHSKVETRIGDRYKPDVVQLDEDGRPLFWAEAGQVGKKKIVSLVRRFPDTHFSIAKWDMRLDNLADLVQAAIDQAPHRSAPFDLIRFPTDSYQRFMADNGEITLVWDDLEEWRRLNQTRG
ncbi:MAG: hypothetical protein GYB68_07870 [Chloroflexi bacterium]|nr:hypothetical protein [Chloroflexota bacterium]